MARQGQRGSTILLKINFYVNGVLFDPFDVDDVQIYDHEIAGSVVDTITPTHVSVGVYQASFDIPDTLALGTYYDQWTWTAESGMSSKTQRYSFEVLEAAEVPEPEPSPVAQEVACRTKVTWIHRIGLVRTEDMGNGMGVALFWQDAAPTSANTIVHYNVYYADNRLDVLDSWPVAITTEKHAIVNVQPGNEQFFVVRATEFDIDDYDITQLTQIGPNVFQYPAEQELLADIDSYGASIQVADTSEFPDKGFLQINVEVLQYSSKDATTFYVEDTQRGAFTTQVSTHVAGETVRLFRGIEEGNSVIYAGTAAWHKINPRNVDAIGEFNVAEDGYRENRIDIVTTDLSASDANTADFPSYDYTGYHRPSIQDTLSGECVGSYVGGEFDGARGLNFQDRELSQLDAMLQVTGEPIILLRRKQTGRRCRCGSSDLRREHPNTRCQYCFGTGFENGYDRFFNTRPISEKYRNTQGMILIRTSPFSDDLKLESSQGLIQPSEIAAWTIVYPTIKDRDIIVRFNEDFTEEFRYEVLDVTRNRLLFSQSGKQEFRMRRLDKTDVVYQYSAVV